MRGRLSGHAGRHRFAHHHGQRPLGARLGRRRHRGGSRHARPALFDAAAGSDRRQAHRQAQGRHDRDRPRAHRHADAAQARRGRQVRRVLRPRPRQSDDRGPRHHRQHVARIRRHLRLLPDRRRHASRYLTDTGRSPAQVALVAAYAKAQGMYRTKSTPDPMFTDVLKLELSAGRAVARRPEAPAGPRRAQGGEDRLRHGDGEGVQQGRRRRQGHFRSASVARHLARQELRQGRAGQAGAGRGPQSRPRPRRRGDRRDHLVHQYVEPERDDRRRPARPQGGGEGPDRQAVGEDLAGARLAGGRRISRQVRPAEGPRQARLQPGRLRLHHLHRQFRAAGAGDFQDHQRQGSGRRRGALRQPQFRRPRQRRRARELSRLAAAGGRLCARRLDVFGYAQAAARPRQEGQEGLPQGHLAVEPRDQQRGAQDHQQADVHARNTPTCSRATRTGARSASRAA